MKIKVSAIVMLLMCQAWCANGFLDFLYPRNVIGTAVNKTNYIKDIIVAKGLLFKQYIQSVQHKGKRIHTDTVNLIRNNTDRMKSFLGMQHEEDDLSSESMRELNNIFNGDAVGTQQYLASDYDPDAHLTTPQIIARHGYPAESHTVKTEDGYLLTMHRIPHGKKHMNKTGRPVLLHHGVLGSSADWILAGPQNSLAYILADEGYDVWLGNSRGNTYSRAHTSLSSSDVKFWNYSWHEIGYYDLPAYIEYINALKGTKNDLIYIGHSMGTTILFVLLSTRPEYNKKMHSAYAMAPVAYMNDIKSPVRLLAPIAKNIDLVATMFGANEFLPQNAIVRWLSDYGCTKLKVANVVCENILFALTGFDEQEFNSTLLPILLGHIPAGTSTKSLVHYAQEIRAGGRFQYFDYGDSANMHLYDSKEPPEYDLDEVTLPIALFSAKNDWLSSKIDAEKLYKRLKNGIIHRVVSLPSFNHLDFLIGIHARKLVYEKLISLLKKTVRH